MTEFSPGEARCFTCDHLLVEDGSQYVVACQAPEEPGIMAAYAEIVRSGEGAVPRPDFTGWRMDVDFMRLPEDHLIVAGGGAFRLYHVFSGRRRPLVLGWVSWCPGMRMAFWIYALAQFRVAGGTFQIEQPRREEVKGEPEPRGIPSLLTLVTRWTRGLTDAQADALPGLIREITAALIIEMPNQKWGYTPREPEVPFEIFREEALLP